MGFITENIAQIQLNTIAVFGMFLLFGVLGGIVANRVRWLPTITAFMLLGILTGPHGLNLITKDVLAESSILIDIALGLILYKLGNMLHPKEMMQSRRLLFTSVAEASLTFFSVLGLLLFSGYGIVLSCLVGAIAVSSSPAVLVHVSDELRASGPVTERAKSLVAMNNLFSFVIFSAVLPFALISGEKSLGSVLILPVYRLAGAVIIGLSVAWLAVRIARLLRKEGEHYRFAIIIGAVMLTIGLSSTLQVSLLLAPLVMGLATRWFETSKNNLSRVGLGEGGDLFYIVLFVMAGAKIDPDLLIAAGVLPVLLAVVRGVAKIIGVVAVSRFTGVAMLQAGSTSLLLLPMAGMAIGLVATTGNLAPDMGAKVATIVFALVAIFETIGPFAAEYAFRISGEQGKASEDSYETPVNY